MSSTKPHKGGKVLICGMKGVGKTSLVEQLIYGNVTTESDIHPTIEDIYMALIDTNKGGPGEPMRIFDTAGLQEKEKLPSHYLIFPDGYVLVYNPSIPASLDILADIKADIDKNKEKREIPVMVLANIRSGSGNPEGAGTSAETPVPDPSEAVLSRANSWCAREKIKHYTVNAMTRETLFEPFVELCSRIHPPQPKSSFPQLRQVMQKKDKSEA